MKIIKFLFLFIFAVIIGVFAAHNDTLVPISFYPFEYEISVALFVLFFGAMLLGILLSGLACGAKIIHWRKLVRQKNREIEKLKKEIEESKTTLVA